MEFILKGKALNGPPKSLQDDPRATQREMALCTYQWGSKLTCFDCQNVYNLKCTIKKDSMLGVEDGKRRAGIGE